MALSLSAYAKHRKELGLRGQSHVAVLRAIEYGRLTEPAAMRIGNRWQIDPILADAQWSANTDMSSVAEDEPDPPAAPEPVSAEPAATASAPAAPAAPAEATIAGVPKLNVSKAVKAAYEAKLAELEFKKQIGSRVPIEDVKKEAFALGRAIRDNIMSIPDRVAPKLAATTDTREVHRLLTEELRIALRVLADG